jgi:crotonobetainyl-CoA:carnitine CoA-transferase CaiB-like acyl-CoA transferase
MTDSPGWPAAEADSADRPAPLAGLRVLDLSRVLAGPLATMQLSDLGATVVKIEMPGAGDITRGWPPFTDTGESTYHLAVNRNKRSVTADLASAEGQGLVRSLAVGADVLVDNFLPGRLARFGLGVDRLRQDNPGLISATITGYGRDGELAERPGFDFLAQAMGGLMAITGPVGGEPTRVGVAIVDVLAGMQLSQGILAALADRYRTGVGRSVSVALLDTAVFALMNLATMHLVTGRPVERFGNSHPSITPYETVAVADGVIALAVGTDRQFARLAAAVGRPDLARDPRFATNQARVAHRAELRSELGAAFGERTRSHWLGVLVSADVPAAPVNEVAEVFDDPFIRGRTVAEIDGVPQVRSPLRIDDVPLPMRARPPLLGEHTREVAADLARSRREPDPA